MAEAEVPIIDISAFRNASSKPAEAARVVEQVKDACERVGFLAIKNHGVPQSVIDNCFRASKEFFDLEPSQKESVPMSADYPFGYESTEQLSKSLDDQKSAADWKETFQLCLGPANVTPEHKVLWPQTSLRDFESAVTAYYRELEKLSFLLLEIFAAALGLEKGWFHDKVDKHQAALRTLNYPHQDHPPAPGQVRASAHTDYGAFTLLAADEVRGLQVLNADDTWQDVIPRKGLFVVNLGDLMSRWTNDKWKSTMHRVVNPPSMQPASARGDAVHSNRRQSIAYFFNMNRDALIECFPSCCSDTCPAKYDPILAGLHLMQKHEAAMGRSAPSA